MHEYNLFTLRMRGSAQILPRITSYQNPYSALKQPDFKYLFIAVVIQIVLLVAYPHET